MLIPFFSRCRVDISPETLYNLGMTAKVEDAPKRPQKAEQAQREGKFTREALIEAVKKAFQGVEGRIDPRYLWSDAGGHRFRVNCWNDVAIQYSEFVRVIEDGRKLTVRRSHDKK